MMENVARDRRGLGAAEWVTQPAERVGPLRQVLQVDGTHGLPPSRGTYTHERCVQAQFAFLHVLWYGPIMAESTTRNELVCGLPFFTRHADIQLFKKLGFACVYAVGPLAGRPIRIGWTSTPSGRFSDLQSSHWRELKIHDIMWTAGSPLAKRIEKEAHRILDSRNKRMRGSWFDITVDLAVPTLQVAADNLKIPTFTHDAMLDRFEEARDMRANHALRHMGATIANG
jgi:hypothetical protein